MADPGKKDEFEWKEGETLDEDAFSPLGDVRAHGLPKVNRAVARDPVVRKQERERFLAEHQSKPYRSKSPATDGKVISGGDSASGISGDYEDSEFKRLAGKGDRMRGLDFFGKKKK